MKFREAKRDLARQLAKHLKPYGYQWHGDEEAYVRRGEKVTSKILVPAYDYEPKFEFTLLLGIRMSEVEEIYHNFSGTLPAYQGHSCTTVTRLSYLVGRKDSRFLFSSETELNECVARAATIIRNLALPFFGDHSTLWTLSKALNTQANGEPFDIMKQPTRGLHAIILGWLAGRSDLELLAETVLDEMAAFPEVERQRVQMLMAFVRGN